jgi:hypothetical protein
MTAAARRDLILPTRGKEADEKQQMFEKHGPEEGGVFQEFVDRMRGFRRRVA